MSPPSCRAEQHGQSSCDWLDMADHPIELLQVRVQILDPQLASCMHGEGGAGATSSAPACHFALVPGPGYASGLDGQIRRVEG